jgi:YD repeat-containing protein
MKRETYVFAAVALFLLILVAVLFRPGGRQQPAPQGDVGEASESGIEKGPLPADERGGTPDGAIGARFNPVVTTSVAESAARLYSGKDSRQTGVAAGTIHEARAAIVRGVVRERDGKPMAGVALSVRKHPEFGRTTSRDDGTFDLALNGGGTYCVEYEREGFLPVCRHVSVPWQEFVWLPDVCLVPVDEKKTAVAFSTESPVQVARANPVNDDDGQRQPTLVFPKGTEATLLLSDGTSKPVESLTVRATEFTVGKNGPRAMPASLPASSAYTYAVELSADEAGGADVKFSKPVYHYVENFLELPVGIPVPTGYFDRDKGAWIPAENGRIIQVLDVKDGLAIVDLDGKGAPASASALAGLGITDEERRQLAALYKPMQSLWRVPIPHFSTWDCNWGFSPPGDAADPDGDAEGDENSNPCDPPGSSADNFARGSIIEIHNQVLREMFSIVGTSFQLAYSSNRVSGRKYARTARIQLSGSKIPESLKRIELEVLVAGQKFLKEDFPAQPDLSYLYEWDGLDGFGQPVAGAQPARVRIGYVYQGVYEQVERFGQGGRGIPITGSRTRQEVALWREFQTTIGGWDARNVWLGGWTLDVHHAYDQAGRVLHLGNGHERRADGAGGQQAFNLSIASIAGGGTGNDIGDGGQATDARLDNPDYRGGAGTARDRMPYIPRGIAVAPDGVVYVVDESSRIRRIGVDGVISTVAGGGRADPGPGATAVDAYLDRPGGIGLALDGSLYIAEPPRHRILRLDPEGRLSVIAGTGSSGFGGDGGPATAARLSSPMSVAADADGSLYIADLYNNRVRRLWPDGTITTIAGTGKQGYSGDGGPATEAELYWPTYVALAPDGSIYFSDHGNYVVRRITPAGVIVTVAGTPQKDYAGGYSGDGGPATAAKLNDPTAITSGPGGSLLIADTMNHRIRRVGPDGTITTLVGREIEKGKSGAFSGDGGPASNAQLSFPTGLGMGHDGSLYFVDGLLYIRDPEDSSRRSPTIRPRVRRVAPPLAGFGAEELVIPSESGREVYRFDARGRHLETLDGLTKGLVHRFRYDEADRLSKIEDGFGNVTTIERDAAGNPVAIIAPFGQRTRLVTGAEGYLAAIENPGGAKRKLAYGAGGHRPADFADRPERARLAVFPRRTGAACQRRERRRWIHRAVSK